MKKVLFAILLMTSISCFSQAKLGIQGGYNLAVFGNPNNNNLVNYTGISSFHIGITDEEAISKHVFFQTGLSYEGKGSHTSKTSFALDGSTTDTKLGYLELPLDLGTRIKLGNKVKALAGAGLYGAIGITGSEKGTYQSSTGTTSPVNNKVSFTNNPTNNTTNETYVRPFDPGYNVFAGVEWEKFQLTADFSEGFKGVYPTTGSDKYNNEVLSFSLVYFFKTK